MGLLDVRLPAPRRDLERATDLFRAFREQPTPELARSAQVGARSAISPNERLQQLFHPWTSYVIVPLFALANAGIAIDGGFLARAFTSPITLGILSATWSASRSASSARSWLATRADPRARCARRSAGRRWPAAARSPGSASPSRC